MARRNRRALGVQLRWKLKGLRYLAQELNADVTVLRPGEESLNRSLREEAAAIINAMAGAPHPAVPPEAARRFNALADESPVYYVARPREQDRDQHFWIQAHGSPVYLRMSELKALWVVRLNEFLLNPHRNRLRQCPVCGRWFVDDTRNQSKQRCSRRCTNAWWNRQVD